LGNFGKPTREFGTVEQANGIATGFH
jgi:hypothetical protein